MKRFWIIVLLLLALTLAACGGRQASVSETPAAGTAAETPAEENPNLGYHEYLPERTPEREAEESLTEQELAAREAQRRANAEERARAFLNGMTLEEKVGQLFFACSRGGDMAEDVARCHLGGVLLFTADYKDVSENWLAKDEFSAKLQNWQAAAQSDTGLPLLIGSDEEGGTVTRASRNPNLFPAVSKSPQQLYAAGGIGAILNDTMQKSYILHELGINLNFAPVCDVSTNPADFIYDRSFGQDARTTAAYVERVVMAMGDAGMGSVLKHFPGYGNNVDTHTGIAVDERPYETFVNSDFLPFRAGIGAGSKITPFVLVSHNIVNCMDPELPASLSPAVHSILRKELGFEGVILTDDLAMDALKAYVEDGSAAVLALKAGNDMLVTSDYEAQIRQVLAAVEDGTLSREVIDLACLHVLRAKAERFAMPYELEGVTP